jgi:hypothetical protein
VASANSPRVTEIRKSSRTFADLISRPTQRVAFVWNEPKRWLAAPATAIFASPAAKQSRTCKASASGSFTSVLLDHGDFRSTPSNRHRQRRSAGRFRANRRRGISDASPNRAARSIFCNPSSSACRRQHMSYASKPLRLLRQPTIIGANSFLAAPGGDHAGHE